MTEPLLVHQNSRPYLLQQIESLTKELIEVRSKLAQARDALQVIYNWSECATKECGTGTCAAVRDRAIEALEATR